MPCVLLVIVFVRPLAAAALRPLRPAAAAVAAANRIYAVWFRPDGLTAGWSNGSSAL